MWITNLSLYFLLSITAEFGPRSLFLLLLFWRNVLFLLFLKIWLPSYPGLFPCSKCCFPSQEVLLWIKSVVDECGESISTEQLKEYVWKTLNSGKVSSNIYLSFQQIHYDWNNHYSVIVLRDTFMSCWLGLLIPIVLLIASRMYELPSHVNRNEPPKRNQGPIKVLL